MAAESTDDAPHRLSLQFDYDTERRARVVERAVRVEVGEIDDARSTARVGRTGRTVEVRIGAADLVALRAGANTWRRLLSVAEQVAETAPRR
ncbi:KEOPS complex Pcc1-like subunit [Haloplanus rallus]|uniref:KEOPS complex Pcc1-like subunit n=1 Tax=Haloplanus rallus TaxID=1816183 RepID=A0A6B9F4T3_9EURY|nr:MULTISPECIES: KEOPS complex subunit Pcc1 [Haloplanus]QGX95348.1 KEOPS complex Pcc1-like subunit [Haloplanus rallus]